jgi:hypothetical protein
MDMELPKESEFRASCRGRLMLGQLVAIALVLAVGEPLKMPGHNPPAGQQFQDLVEEYEQGRRDFLAALRKANTEAEAEKVMERLWKVAWCFFDEAAQKREAHQWVEERLRRLLEGKADSVVRGLRYQSTQRGLRSKRKTVQDAAEYFERNRGRMKYDEYLA